MSRAFEVEMPIHDPPHDSQDSDQGHGPCEIVLCYRRETAGDFAYTIHSHLTSSGRIVFWDQDHPPGDWHARMLTLIGQARYVLVALTSKQDLVTRHTDYFAEEIEHALNLNKIVIPIMNHSFEWPSPMPLQISRLEHQQGITVSHENRRACLDRLISLLDNRSAPTRRTFWLPGLTIGALLFTLILLFIYWRLNLPQEKIRPTTPEVTAPQKTEEVSGNWALYFPENGREMISVEVSSAPPAASGPIATRLSFALQSPWWCGIGMRSSRPRTISRGGQLVFSAKGERGGEQVQIKVGVSPQSKEGVARSEWLTLSTDWHQFILPIDSKMSTDNLFTLVVDKAHNPTGLLTVFVSDIALIDAVGGEP